MYVRVLKHKNGRSYIQVIEKRGGKYVVRKSFGSGNTPEAVQKLKLTADRWVANQTGLQEFDFVGERELFNKLLDNISSLKLVGIEFTLGRLFDEIGFNNIEDELFRHLVLYRLVYPKSKLKTTEYLYRYEGKQYSEDEIYRYMDKLHNKQKDRVQQISYAHTLSLFPKGIQVVFYDVTTVYFEIDQEDELRKTGFSKEGKHENPQIVLGLLVSRDGYPLAYDIFEGNKFEGHTMMPVIDGFKQKYNLEQLIIVADSGLLSRSNIEQLQEQNYEFILGARIKNESTSIKDKILTLQLKNGESAVINKGDLRLIITYSDKRAEKDQYNRKKGINRLSKQIRSGRLTKDHINKRGYNKFLRMEGQINLVLDQHQIAQDKKWDGLKGYLTNSKLNKDQLIENYQHLWQIEKAFRVAKTELKLRPVFHRRQRRIEAHICLNFAAYKVYKELERFLKENKSSLSPQKVIEIAQNIHQIELTTPTTKDVLKKTIILSEEQKDIERLFQFGC
ncbi:MAG: IS1634 family transposase [Flavobacteriales bacterium]|nr:IS1634 family transposase [Flavobacteriales bacterium]MCB9251712.1 IS1634 family transposase [Flavobacteriales bacterium]MCB9252187.1 IS1634 family transposase [Flavobacteriales bacterium]